MIIRTAQLSMRVCVHTAFEKLQTDEPTLCQSQDSWKESRGLYGKYNKPGCFLCVFAVDFLVRYTIIAVEITGKKELVLWVEKDWSWNIACAFFLENFTLYLCHCNSFSITSAKIFVIMYFLFLWMPYPLPVIFSLTGKDAEHSQSHLRSIVPLWTYCSVMWGELKKDGYLCLKQSTQE